MLQRVQDSAYQLLITPALLPASSAEATGSCAVGGHILHIHGPLAFTGHNSTNYRCPVPVPAGIGGTACPALVTIVCPYKSVGRFEKMAFWVEVLKLENGCVLDAF